MAVWGTEGKNMGQKDKNKYPKSTREYKNKECCVYLNTMLYVNQISTKWGKIECCIGHNAFKYCNCSLSHFKTELHTAYIITKQEVATQMPSQSQRS